MQSMVGVHMGKHKAQHVDMRTKKPVVASAHLLRDTEIEPLIGFSVTEANRTKHATGQVGRQPELHGAEISRLEKIAVAPPFSLSLPLPGTERVERPRRTPWCPSSTMLLAAITSAKKGPRLGQPPPNICHSMSMSITNFTRFL